MILPIAADKIEEVWPIVGPYVHLACEQSRGTIAEEDVKRFCLSRDMQMFAVLNGEDFVGAVTTEVLEYPQTRVLRVVTVGGNGWECWGAELSAAIDEFARHVGATLIEAQGRKGWVKKLNSLGYEPVHTLYYKTVGE